MQKDQCVDALLEAKQRRCSMVLDQAGTPCNPLFSPRTLSKCGKLTLGSLRLSPDNMMLQLMTRLVTDSITHTLDLVICGLAL